MAKSGVTGLPRIINAFGYSMKGFRSALRYESAFRQESVLFMLLLPLAFWLGHSLIDYILLIGALLLVLIVELLNSAIEATVDRFGDDYHELSGTAKDMGSAAVFVSLVNVVMVWACIIFNNYFSWSSFTD